MNPAERLQSFAVGDHPSYRPDIDGLRAIAVISVVTFHAAPGRLPGGFIGVDIFLVISGFLISTIIIKGLTDGSFSYHEFYGRRISRIFPALIVVLSACLLAGLAILSDDELRGLGKHIAAGAGFVSNIALWLESGYFDGSSDYKPLLHLWSLGVEEQFYIFCPLLLVLLSGRKIGYLAPLATVAAISFAVNVYESDVDPVAAFYLSIARFWELLVGSCLAWIVLQRDAYPAPLSSKRSAVSLLGLCLLAASLVTVDKTRSFPGWWAALPAAGTVLVIWAGPHAWPNRALLSNPIAVWIGLISYPLYLWHWPALSFLRILEGGEIAQWKRFTAIAAAVLLAWLTYEAIERPVRRSGSQFVIPVALVLSMSVVGSVGIYLHASNGIDWRLHPPTLVNAGEVGHGHFFEYIRTNSFPCTPSDIRANTGDWNGIVRCFQSKSGDLKDIALIGDSHAEHLFPGLADRLPARNVAFYGRGGLPFLGNKEFDRIFEFVISDSNITTVIIAANWRQKLRQLPTAEWKSTLGKTVSYFVEHGKSVYLIGDVPQFSFLPNRCKFAGRLGLENKCSEWEELSGGGQEPALREIAEAGGVEFIPVSQLFCRDRRCSMAHDGAVLFRDEHHLNIPGSAMVADKIASRLPR